MKNIRIWFKKIDTAKYISHLDLQRCMARAIHKAKLPFWYTEGFNPHVFLTITMPISLGYTGLRESMDVKLLDDEMEYSVIIDKLNSGLPKDIRIYDITEVVMKPSEVGFSEYVINIDSKNSDLIKNNMISLLSQEEIMIDKKTKKGLKKVDIKSYFVNAEMKLNDDGDLQIHVVLPSSVNGSINPRLLFDAYRDVYQEELYYQVSRVNCYNENMKEFK